MNRRKIAIAALELVEREGIEALTMKRLAEEVDRKPASLYNHIAGRQDLIEAMRGILSEHIDASFFESLGWRDALLAWAREYLKAFARHPKIIAVMATTAISDPATLAAYEQVVASLARGGWRRGEAVAVMRAVEAYVLGSALDIVAPDTLLNRDSIPAELTELRENLDPRDAESWSAQAAFELGIHALLDGLVSTLERNGASRAL
ncbi:TetR/AcrR family transcriptional regulator [Paeniglutamicibacter sp. NPDC012692]|uniref:TetR/AcrR family transcriptional regulator n=1 Tax=Paeniglutamicibacter sp. NPDC012692 TaxID=3364388 RepID=UPI0036A3E5A5